MNESTLSGDAARHELGSDAAASPSRANTWKNPWVLGWIGLIVVVLAVNITMIVLAIATNPGLIRSDYYERGRDVERTILTRLAEGPRWTMSIDLPADTRAEEATKVRFAVVDQTGQPVQPERVTYYVYRPSDAGRDFSVPMARQAPGIYEAEVSFPLGGIWDTLVSVEHDGKEHSLGQRVSVALP
jgi:nitrogen fixation protein FixH